MKTFILFTCLLCSLGAVAGDSCGFFYDYQGRQTWKNLPISINFHKNVPTKYRPAMIRAMRTWERSLNYLEEGLFKIGVDERGPIPEDNISSVDWKNVIYWTSTWPAATYLQQAMADLKWSGRQYIDTDIYINAGNYLFATTEKELIEDRRVDMESLMLHELGHVLGLEHVISKGKTASRGESVMDPVLDFKKSRRKLDLVTLNNARCSYGN